MGGYVVEDKAELLRLLYRVTLHWLVERAKAEACRVAKCRTSDGSCSGRCSGTLRSTDIESLIQRCLSCPTASDAIWLHAQSVLEGLGGLSIGAIVQTLVAVHHNIAGWLLEQQTRLFHHLIRILHNWRQGPPVPTLPNQFVFPCLSIAGLDKKMGIEDKVAAYKAYWTSARPQVTAELAVFPPRSGLEEQVFQVKIPDYRVLYTSSCPFSTQC
jgi:hypothetical protein